MFINEFITHNVLCFTDIAFHIKVWIKQIFYTLFQRCQRKFETYPKNLPTASIIVCFHNEAQSVLLRTFHSILNRTPPDLLIDIIAIDDASTLGMYYLLNFYLLLNKASLKLINFWKFLSSPKLILTRPFYSLLPT